MTIPIQPGATGSWATQQAQLYGAEPNQLLQGGGFGSTYMTPGQQISGSDVVFLPVTSGRERGRRQTYTFDQARNLPMIWAAEDQDTLRRFVNTGILRKIRGFNVNMGMPEILDAWENMLEQSWRMNEVGKLKDQSAWTPWDVMETYSNAGNYGTSKSADGNWLVDVGTGERIKYIGPKSKTTKESRINLSSPEDVRALTTQMLSEMLGRAPTAEEMAKYRASINDYERANPQTATTTVTLNDMGEQVSSNTVTSGGASQAALQEIVAGGAKKGPEYGKYQGGARYFNLLERLVGGG